MRWWCCGRVGLVPAKTGCAERDVVIIGEELLYRCILYRNLQIIPQFLNSEWWGSPSPLPPPPAASLSPSEGCRAARIGARSLMGDSSMKPTNRGAFPCSPRYCRHFYSSQNTV